MAGPEGTTVHVVDDDAAFRESTSLLLKTVGLSPVCYSTAVEFLERFDNSKRGCAIIDIRMPIMSGLQLQQELNALKCTLPIVIVTAYANVNSAVRAMSLGATDLIEKPFSSQQLLDAVHHAIGEDIAQRKLQAATASFNERLRKLTAREQEVLRLVCDGMSSREIGLQLGVSFKTIQAHRGKIMSKMGASSLPHLVRMCFSQRFPNNLSRQDESQ